MQIQFYKYQGSGNDFIMLDNRDGKYESVLENQIQLLCNRHFGIGADGLILLETLPVLKMVYYNSDGKLSSFCGNGGRCFTAFAKMLGVIKNEIEFTAFDGIHHATISNTNEVKLSMNNVNKIIVKGDDVWLDTGSPHYIQWHNDVENIDVVNMGRSIRYNNEYAGEGTNVNFVSIKNNMLTMRTYERGVEDETLSCGTGVTAAAIASVEKLFLKSDIGEVNVQTKGGNLKVYFKKNNSNYTEIYLCGEVNFVYEGIFII